MPSLFDQFTGTCSVTTLKKLPSDDSSLKNPTMQVKMKLFDFFSKKIKKMTPTPSLCSRPDHKRRKAEVQAVDDQANESLNKLRTILSLYNPEQYSPRILSVNKDVWLQKIEDAYHAYLGSVRFLDEFYTQDEKEEAETEYKCVHDDVVNFVATLLNKSSLSANQSTSTMAANVIDVSTSDVTSTSENAAEAGVISDNSNESSRCLETIAESNPQIIEDVVPQSQVVSKAPVGPDGSMVSRAVAEKMVDYLVAQTYAVFRNKLDTNPEPCFEEADDAPCDVSPVHSHPEDVPSPVLSHRDRGRSDEIILDLSGCSPSQIIQKLKNRAVPDPEGALKIDAVHIHSKDPVEEKDAKNQDVSVKSCARLRSSNRSPSRCRRKDSRSW